MPADAVLLLGHGTVENLDDLPRFLSNIRRGRPSPPELVAEIRRRYQAIGGSPLLSISRALAQNLERKTNAKVYLAMRFWHPFAKDVLSQIASDGCTTLRVVPLAPYSGHVYESEMRQIAGQLRSEGITPPLLQCAPNWGAESLLLDAFAAALLETLARLPDERRAEAHVLFSAHSLPLSVVDRGDPYPGEVRKAAEAIVARSRVENPWRLVYQSQGATPDPWLGPGVEESLRVVAEKGGRDVVFCPIGFLSDHIEILYDLDVEAKKIAEQLGLAYIRTVSLNASPALVDAIAAVAGRLAHDTVTT